MEKNNLLDRAGASGDERILLAHILDRREQTGRRNIPAATDFLSPQEQAMAERMLHLAGDEIPFVLWGGYDGAERKMIVFLPDWMAPEAAQPPLQYLRAVYRPEDGLTHRDILGSLMGLGIAREKVGDLLVGEGSCDLIVAESIADFLLSSWEITGRTRVSVASIEAENLHIPQLRTEEIRDTVATLRLDAVAASGFHMARGKTAELIEGGRVQLNCKECLKPDRLLEQGDTVSARGLGKFVLAQVGGMTRKGRTAILIKRYL